MRGGWAGLLAVVACADQGVDPRGGGFVESPALDTAGDSGREEVRVPGEPTTGVPAGSGGPYLDDGERPANGQIHRSSRTNADTGLDLSLSAEVDALDESLTFAVIGDYGNDGTNEAAVAALVRSWSPDAVITVGDNNYQSGAASTIDANIGKHYQEFIFPYFGSFGAGSPTGANRFFPSLGNHDWETPNAQPYLDYFTLPTGPGSERYYEFVLGPVHFFAVDSDSREPHGATSTSAQAQWLRSALTASTSPWKVVYFHHSPYVSASNQVTRMRWPFAAWGADVVLSGHSHLYERLQVGGLPYIVNGLGGNGIYAFTATVAGSLVRYNTDYGAMRATATDDTLTFQFVNRSGVVIDTLSLGADTGAITTSFQNGVAPTAAYAGTVDTRIRQVQPTTNAGGAATCGVDGDDGGGDLSCLLRWDISSIPTDATVTSASITFNVTNATSEVYSVHPVLRSWVENRATWNVYATGTPWQTAGAAGSLDRGAAVGTVGPAAAGSYTVTLGAAGIAEVQRWVGAPSANFGLLLAGSTPTDGFAFSSSEAGTAALRPRLTVTYE